MTIKILSTKIFLSSVVLFLSLSLYGVAASAPTLFFTDLASAPNTGGETVGGFSGAYVTLYGNNFGTTPSVTWNGLNCLRIVTVGGNQVNTWLWYQKLVVQLGSSCTAGNGNFVITTANGTSNGVSFTARSSGGIQFAATTGNDSTGTGSFASPWRTIPKCKDSISAGGVCYIENGVNQTTVSTYGAVDIGSVSGCSSVTPCALVAYPGAVSTIGSSSITKAMQICSGLSGCPGGGQFWTVAGFSLRGTDWAIDVLQPNVRIVGNIMQCTGSAVAGCFETESGNAGVASNIVLFGSDVGNITTGQKTYHAVYFGADGVNIEAGWNDVHDNVAGNGIQYYSDAGPGHNISIHDNVVFNIRNKGIVIDHDGTGYAKAFNNLLYHVGAGPALAECSPGNCYFDAFHLVGTATPSNPIQIFNNTVYDSGSLFQSGFSGVWYMDSQFASFTNNIIYILSGEAFPVEGNTSLSLASGQNNLLFKVGSLGTTVSQICAGSSCITIDPGFVDATTTRNFHLSSVSSSANGQGLASWTGGTMPVLDHDGLIRPSPPSIGAYEFQAGTTPTAATPTFSPVAGTYSGAQTVTISTTSAGAILCYTTNGTTPATNSTTGCTAGTLGSLVNVAVSETLKAVAGGTGFIDSSVASAAYTISVPPTVVTNPVTAITSTTASAGGTVTSAGGSPVTSEGTCYGTTASPTSPCTSNGTATPFTSSISGLTPNTLYHYRAFATSPAGTAYGQDYTFVTSVCALPYPVERCDLNPISFPALPPSVGGLTGRGATFVDPNFNTTVYRVSDSSLNQPATANSTINVAVTGSGEENPFNCNSTMAVISSSAGAYYPINFTPPTFSRMYTTTLSATNGFVLPGTFMGWGRVCPNRAGLAYTVAGTVLESFNLAGNTPTGTAPTPTTVFDFASSANCLGIGFTPTYFGAGGGDIDDSDWAGLFSNSGGQDGTGAVYIVAWRSGSGCRLLNLSTDVVTGDWGPTGTISGNPCLATAHSVKIFKYGGTLGAVRITPTTGNCSNQSFVWVYGATSLTGSLFNSCSTQCGGHAVNGMLATVNNPENAVPNYLVSCQINGTCPTNFSGLTMAVPVGLGTTIDLHPGWNSINDSAPFCSSTYRVTPGTPTLAWQNEIVCIPPAPGQNWWRMASTYNSGSNPDVPTAQAIGAVSQDGKWYMWTSDWMGTVGATGSASFSNIDDSLTNWGTCNISCAGGTGTATGVSQTINNPSPSLDGAAMQISLTGPVLSGGQTTNELWFNKVGANNAATSFVGTWHVFVPSVANIAALEYDQFQFNAGQRYMFGSQCLIGGVWQIWNQLAGTWVNTAVSCNLSTSAWHSIAWATHRVTGDTSCSGQPCMYYDSLTIDGTVFSGFAPQPSGTSADPDNIGIQTQIDVNASGGTATEYLDQHGLTYQLPNRGDVFAVRLPYTPAVAPVTSVIATVQEH